MNKIITQKNCKTCNKEYMPGIRNSDFCGITCFNKSKIGTKHPQSQETKNKIRETLKRLGLIPKSAFKKGNQPWNTGKKMEEFAEETRLKMSQAHKAEKHWNWQGGINYLHQTERQVAMKQLMYKNWRRLVFIRDNFTCQYCKQIGGKLRAHHIKKWSEYLELRYEIDNGITLCEFCHKELHKIYKLTLNKDKYATTQI